MNETEVAFWKKQADEWRKGCYVLGAGLVVAVVLLLICVAP